MKTSRIILLVVVLAVTIAVSSALIVAQDSTAEPSSEETAVPSSFSDNRINGDIFLGGLAIYCEDASGPTDSNTFQNGGISVWGPDGQKYISLTVDELRGDEEIVQPPPTAEAEPEATVEPSSTEEATLASPVLLAQAETTNGTIWLFRVGEDAFSLQGTDNTGKFFTYIWLSCEQGILSTDTAPIIPGTAVPMLDVTAEATMEATAES